MTLYREHRVYRKGVADTVLYVCLEDLSRSMFTVQQAEFLREGELSQARIVELARNTLELFVERNVDGVHETKRWYASLSEAIEAHDREFEN